MSIFNRDVHPHASPAVARAAWLLLASAAVQAVVTVLHFAHGAHTYQDPGRLHVVAPALVALALSAALAWLFTRRPSRVTLAALVLVVVVPFVLVFGLVHGGWFHAAKLLVFLHGASEQTLEGLFLSPDYAYPNDLVFEASGVLTLLVGGWVAQRAWRLVREWHRPETPRASGGDGEPRRHATPGRASPGEASVLRLGELALRMLLDAPWKSLGTLIAVVVSVFLMAQQWSLLSGILGRVTSFVDSSGVDIWISSVATEATDATDSIPASKEWAAASTPGVAWAAPVVQAQGRVTRPDGVRENVKVLGVQAPRYAGLPRTLAPGTTLDSLRGSGRILLNWNDRPTFAAAEPGDRIEINGRAGVVAGFFEGVNPHNPFYYVFANIDDARALTDFPQDRITYVAVGVAPGFRPEDVSARLQARVPEVLVKTRDEMAEMEKRFFLVRTPVGVVFGLGTVVAAFIGAAIVAVTLYSSAIDRARDYGTLKAIGARRKDILGLMFAQAWLYAGAGYALGLAAFLILRAHLPDLPMVAPPRLVVGVGLTALGSCTLASLAAVGRVLRLDPAIVFRG